MKQSKSILEFPTITVLVAAFDAKSFNATEFGNFHICFFLTVLKKTNTLHICVAA